MAKSSRKQIDEDEKKILVVLEINAKEGIDVIAKKCGFSRQKVWRVIKRLEKDHTIWGYAAVVDKEKQNLNGYVVLIKRSNQPFDRELIDKITTRELEDLVPKSQVKIENSAYVHGVYDWIISFTAEDIRQAKQFCESLNRTYQGYLSEMHLLETMFSIKEKGILNPEINKLREFL
ncbi:MAG: Lrp/AsnC family transcriptional regulator [Thermoplasmatales archaeon]|nr:Lrp/AsnC family transcriptional regulator [Thermoplasmatales archaeon]